MGIAETEAVAVFDWRSRLETLVPPTSHGKGVYLRLVDYIETLERRVAIYEKLTKATKTRTKKEEIRKRRVFFAPYDVPGQVVFKVETGDELWLEELVGTTMQMGACRLLARPDVEALKRPRAPGLGGEGLVTVDYDADEVEPGDHVFESVRGLGFARATDGAAGLFAGKWTTIPGTPRAAREAEDAEFDAAVARAQEVTKAAP